MKTVADLPMTIDEMDNVWIPMRDGAQLAGRVWLPRAASEYPVPAILEYIPYRKRFGTARRDAVSHAYMAGHGYACVRVDLRGSGESDGVLSDEYLQQELDDGCDVIHWLAKQPWCDGNVGMMGISWGGFNALQIAAMRPAPLKAVISLCSTDDRYADDVHHMGGCLLGDNLSWASVMLDYNALPPDPVLVGNRWRDMWLERLNGSGLWLAKWLRHQHRDGYWQHGSICEDYAAITCPVYAVSGWADGYSNAVFRLLANLEAPCKGLIGPWSHAYPHLASPGPAIDFLGEALRWWDHWLKGIDDGIMSEPALRVWMQDSVAPTSSYVERPGRWVAEPGWPSAAIEDRQFVLSQHHLLPAGEAVSAHEIPLQSPLTVGLFAGKWCSYAAGPDLAHDQRREDGGSLVFQTTPLADDLEIMGAARATLTVAADRPVAILAVRLSDVQLDDKVTRVSYGLFNLTHRNGSASPAALVPGKPCRVTIQLNDVAHRFPAGHRLRLSISTSYWPLAWPAPEPVQIILYTAGSSLTVPVREPRASDAALKPFGAPRGAPAPAVEVIRGPHQNWLVHHDLARDSAELEVVQDAGCYRLEDIDLTVDATAHEWYGSIGDQVDTVRGRVLRKRTLARGDWRIHTRSSTVLKSNASEFLLSATLDAYEGDERIFSRNWNERIERKLV